MQAVLAHTDRTSGKVELLEANPSRVLTKAAMGALDAHHHPFAKGTRQAPRPAVKRPDGKSDVAVGGRSAGDGEGMRLGKAGLRRAEKGELAGPPAHGPPLGQQRHRGGIAVAADPLDRERAPPQARGNELGHDPGNKFGDGKAVQKHGKRRIRPGRHVDEELANRAPMTRWLKRQS